MEEVLEAAPGRRERAVRKPKKLDGAGEAKLVELACLKPPRGAAAWNLKLPGGKLAGLEIVDCISTETAGRTLKIAS